MLKGRNSPAMPVGGGAPRPLWREWMMKRLRVRICEDIRRQLRRHRIATEATEAVEGVGRTVVFVVQPAAPSANATAIRSCPVEWCRSGG